MTTTGDSVVWDGDGDNSENITFTLQAGTSWNKPAECQVCAATSIVKTDEVREGIKAFTRHFDLNKSCGEGARRLGLGPGGTYVCVMCDIMNELGIQSSTGDEENRFFNYDF
eukprot:scaffold4250_cov57-Attheya_sp.AAC.1